MKIRKSGLLQRMMAVLLAAVLVVGVASDTAPMTVLAQEDTASLTQDGQTEIAEGDTADTVEKDTEPEETDSEEETPKPDEEPEQETPASDKGTEEDTPEPEEETETNPEEAEEIRTDEDGQDVQALLARIAALPDPEEYLATEPDADDWAENEDAYEEACTEWLAGLYEYADEALAIQEEVEKLTKEQRAQISEEELQKLAAWAEIVQTAGEMVQTPEPGAQVLAVESSMMLAAEPAPQADLPAGSESQGWVLDADGKLTISSDAGMENWKKVRDTYKSDVTSAEIQDGVTSIGENAFEGCSSLTEITIPGSVTSIGSRAFYACNSLETVTMQGKTPPSLDSDVFGWGSQVCKFVTDNTQGIHIPAGRLQAYKTAWTDWADYIAEISSGNSDSGSGSSGANAAIGSQSGANAVATPAKAPAAAITTPQEKLEDAVLTAEEKQQKAGGADIRIELDVKAVAAEAVAADRAVVEAALKGSLAKGYTLGQYLAISLYKVAGDSRSAITQTNGKIAVRIAVPEGLKNTDAAKTRTFAVLRVHDGKAQLLADLDREADTITIETDRFSTYAIVYKDMVASGEGGSIQLRAESGGSKESGSEKDDEPKTGDNTPLELSATLAMIAGFAYLLLYVTDRERGMTEERKKELVSCLVAWAKQGGRSRKYLALAAIFVLLVYYHSIGKKMCVRWKAIYGE